MYHSADYDVESKVACSLSVTLLCHITKAQLSLSTLAETSCGFSTNSAPYIL